MPNAGNAPDLATIVQHITNAQPGSLSSLAHILKTFAPEDQRDAVLGGLLPGAQDPLALLNPRINTLGYLYIL
jgi:COP9 signalosome complex subunit 3